MQLNKSQSDLPAKLAVSDTDKKYDSTFRHNFKTITNKFNTVTCTEKPADHLQNSAVQILFFHFESNQIAELLFEISNRIE